MRECLCEEEEEEWVLREKEGRAQWLSWDERRCDWGGSSSPSSSMR